MRYINQLFILLLFIFTSSLCNTNIIGTTIESSILEKREEQNKTNENENTEEIFKFKVVSFTENEYDTYLVYNKQYYLMEKYIYPLYVYKMSKSQLLSTDNIQYHFIVCEKDDTKCENPIEEENFERTFTFEMSNSKTYNHIFNREKDLYEVKHIPRVYEPFKLTVQSKLFDDRFVPTIILYFNKENKKKLDEYHNDPQKGRDDLTANLVYISPFVVKKFKNVSVNISGNHSLKNKKLSYKISDINGDDDIGLYHRKAIKLRADQGDISYLREKLVYTLMDSMGVPTQGCTYTRLVINNQNIGLFIMIDHISSRQYMKQVLNRGKKFKSMDNALLYKVDNDNVSVGNLVYHDDNPKNEKYNAYQLKKSTQCKHDKTKLKKNENTYTKNELIPLFKTIHDLKSDTLPQLYNVFHVESFLRTVVIDYLVNGVDNYLFWGDNYYLMKNANQKENDYRWYFIGTDYHYTFGSDGFIPQMRDNFYNQSAYNSEIETVRQPIDKLLEINFDEYSRQINETIKRTVEMVFNPTALYPFIDSTVEMIKEDVLWDLMMVRVNDNGKSSGKVKNFDTFTVATQDEDNLDIHPLPLKAFIKFRSKIAANEVNAHLPQSESDIKTDILGYTKPELVSYFEEESLKGFDNGAFYQSLHYQYHFILIFIIAFYIYYY